jgi:hypothetical protein
MRCINFEAFGVRAVADRCHCGAFMVDVGADVECCANVDHPHARRQQESLDGVALELAVILRGRVVRETVENREYAERQHAQTVARSAIQRARRSSGRQG